MKIAVVRIVAAATAFAFVSQIQMASAEAGLFAKLFGCKKTECCEPAPDCCEPAPEPECCEPEPEPVCCEPEPEPVCCEPEPAPECCSAMLAPPELAEGEVLVWISPVLTPIHPTSSATMVVAVAKPIPGEAMR